ncbi:hypothetical protein FBZ89_101415 [Nitrospirillum amazonense]|uniref:Tsi6 domain-containing protein n=1 Tax=Nitrospirillum amazonense TaxID=28077 RepID=A0A560FT43_9PROT|nr:immunity protein Tsi6 family protein [Nitrospirillum amazonense]TWB24789.1 hypothetical protein FBZ89_101415 [Nitrospirillum amazonense]
MTAIETVEYALNLARQRLSEMPAFEIFASAVAQLEYLLSVLQGNPDRTRLKNIIVGHYGAREFAESDPEFAQALMSAQNIATKISKGLKV